MNYLEAYDNGTRGDALDGIRRAYRLLFQSQYWDRSELDEYRWDRLRRVYAYARKHVPYYSDQFSPFDSEIESWEQFKELPILSRETAAERSSLLRGNRPPIGVSPLQPIRTSGTSGSVVESIPTDTSEQFRTAVSVRELEWANIEPTGSALMLRALAKPGSADADALRYGLRTSSWASGWLAELITTGPGYYIDVSAPAQYVAKFGLECRPDYILAFPSALAAAARYVQGLAVRGVRTIGETLHDEWRDPIEKTFAAPIQDLYSSQEVGPIAATCPSCGAYHTMDEWVYCEIVRNDGTDCQPGEEGRVLVTNLHPYITPFIRYDLGDRAVVGQQGTCKKTLGTVSKVTGRTFGFLRMPDGSLRSASPMFYAFTAIPELVAAQVVQPRVDEFLVKVVGSAAVLSDVDRALRESVGESAEVRIDLVDELDRSIGGKIERFRWTGS